MAKELIKPDYIFEVSWEVCNKIGGIYTVLSTKAKTLQKLYQDKIFFIGPDLSEVNDYFIEDKAAFAEWVNHAKDKNGLEIRVGRWDVPGKPYVFLVNFQPFFSQKNMLYAKMWEWYRVNSLQAYGDYDEACIFAFSTSLVIESFYRFYQLHPQHVIAHFNEWTTGMGALYIQQNLPQIATVFTTHATSMGRSIAGNNKPLYSQLRNYDGDQMAHELNMVAKHSLEKQTALHVDCFTTVSEITALECEQLLGRKPDVVVLNGFEDNFVPKGKKHSQKREEARHILLYVAENMLGYRPASDAFLIATSGRYEYKNKGIDVFIDAMAHLNRDAALKKDVIAFIMVPAHVDCPRKDLLANMNNDIIDPILQFPYTTHWLHNQEQDNILNQILYRGFKNQQEDAVKIIFVPSYLTDADGIFNKTYYDLLIGMDATVFPSYYEPWGYTPLESIAFGMPTITTNLAGFGLWAQKEIDKNPNYNTGVSVIHRTDFNYFEVVENIAEIVKSLIGKTLEETYSIHKQAMSLSSKAHWSIFIQNYVQAYHIALSKLRVES